MQKKRDSFFIGTVESFLVNEKRKMGVSLLRNKTNRRYKGNCLYCSKNDEFLKRDEINKEDKNNCSRKMGETEQSIFPLNMDWIKVINLISESNDVEALTLAFNAGLSAIEKKGCLTTILELFEIMKRKNIKPDIISYKLILSLCEKYHLVENAEVLFQEMVENDKILPNYEIYSIMISCFSKRGYADKAIEFFEKLRNDPFIEERKKMNILDPERMGKWKTGEQKESFFKGNESTSDNESKFISDNESKSMSDNESESKSIPDNEHNYNKQFSEISGKIKKIEKKNAKIQYSEYANVIFACNLGNAQDDGIKYFEELISSGNYIPSIFVLENIFDLLEKNGNYEKALEYYNKFKHDPYVKNNITVHILNNLLKCLSIYMKINIIEDIWNNEFDELLLTPNEVSYQLMLKVYSDTDEYEKAFKLFKEMQIKKMLHGTNILPFLYAINSFKNCGIYNYAMYVLRVAKFVNMSNQNMLLLYNNTMVVCANAKRYDVIISLYAELIKLQQKDTSFHLNINTLSFILLAFKEMNMMEDFKSLKNLIEQKNYKLTPLCVKLFEDAEKEKSG